MAHHDSDEMKSSTPDMPGSAQPPDRASGGGDVSTTGESARDVERHEAGAHGEAPDAHAGHGTTTGHGGQGAGQAGQAGEGGETTPTEVAQPSPTPQSLATATVAVAIAPSATATAIPPTTVVAIEGTQTAVALA